MAITEATTEGRSHRISIHLEAFYSYGRMEDDGVLANISYSGALIENTTIQPEIGTPVTLYVYLKPPSAFEATTPFKLSGHVVRHCAAGFAIAYEDDHDPDIRQMVDDAAAVVAGSS
jgi:hypothetical protein